jgi:hypothetical protein
VSTSFHSRTTPTGDDAEGLLSLAERQSLTDAIAVLETFDEHVREAFSLDEDA